MTTMKVLAIYGSLRSVSVNRMLLLAAIPLSPTGMEIVMSPDIGKLPLYNPDLEHCVPDQVARFRTQVAVSQALLIASPEYGHGVTGTLKKMRWIGWLASSRSPINPWRY